KHHRSNYWKSPDLVDIYYSSSMSVSCKHSGINANYLIQAVAYLPETDTLNQPFLAECSAHQSTRNQTYRRVRCLLSLDSALSVETPHDRHSPVSSAVDVRVGIGSERPQYQYQ